MFILSPTKTLGLDISDLSIKAVQIKKKDGQNTIQAMNSIAVPEGMIEEGVIKNEKKIVSLLKKLLDKKANKFTTKYVVSCLPETKTFIKVIEIPAKDIEQNGTWKMICRELPRHIPITVEEAQIDWQEIDSDGKSKKFLVGAAPKKIVDDYSHVCQMAGLETIGLEIEAEAIIRSIIPQVNIKKADNAWLKKSPWGTKKEQGQRMVNERPKIILDLGETRGGLILLDNRVIQFTNSLPKIAGRKITQMIADKKNLNYQRAEKAKIICGTNPKKCKGEILRVLKEAIDDIGREIISSEEFYGSHFGHDTKDIEIILTGGGANMNNIDKTLKEKIKRDIKVGNPLINLSKCLPKKVNNLLSYTTAIGLALRNYI